MGNRVKTISLLVLCLAGVHLVGCFPDNSLEWSDDGLWGLLRVRGSLFLVDGGSGRLTPVEPDRVSHMPAISADGGHIAYVKGFLCDSVEEGLKLFPAPVARMIRDDARQLEQRILAGLVAPGDLPEDRDEKLGYSDSYLHWVIRCMCVDPGAALVEKLGPSKLGECGQLEIGFNRLLIAPRARLQERKVLVTMPLGMFRPRFAPDGRHIAYLMPMPHDEDQAILFLASVDGKIDAMEVAVGVAIGYDWRPDGKALAYIKRDGDPILGALEEKVVLGDDGVALNQPADTTDGDSLSTSRGTQEGRQLVGTLFQPTMHVEYGLDGRMILSSAAAAVPTTELDEPDYSLFCYDRLTGTVTNILPGVLRSQASQNMNFFRLSPDGRRLLVPLRHNRFAVYELGSNGAIFPCEQDEGFGMDDMPDFVPAWKGSERIAALVSEKSHLLGGAEEPARRKEIVLIDTQGQLKSVLSEDWPDDAVPKDMQDKVDDASQNRGAPGIPLF